MKEKKTYDWTEDSFTLNKLTIKDHIFYSVYLHNVKTVNVVSRKSDRYSEKVITCKAKRRDGKSVQVEFILFPDNADKKNLTFKRGKTK